DAADVKRARRAAESRFVSVTGRLPFERLEVQWLEPRGVIALGAWWPDLVEVRWARWYTDPTTYTSLSDDDLAGIETRNALSRCVRRTGWLGCGQLPVGYVAGMSTVPDALVRAFALAIRREITLFNKGTLEQSQTFATDGVVSVGLARPGNGRAYGIDD